MVYLYTRSYTTRFAKNYIYMAKSDIEEHVKLITNNEPSTRVFCQILIQPKK